MTMTGIDWPEVEIDCRLLRNSKELVVKHVHCWVFWDGSEDLDSMELSMAGRVPKDHPSVVELRAMSL